MPLLHRKHGQMAQRGWRALRGGLLPLLALALALSACEDSGGGGGGGSGSSDTGVSLTISGTDGSLALGQTDRLTATLTENGVSADVTDDASWSSSASGVVSVDSSSFPGRISGVAEGSATVTASYSSVSGSSSITVAEPTLSYYDTVELESDTFVLDEVEFYELNVSGSTIGIGLALQGSTSNYVGIDHGKLILDNQGNTSFFISSPSGGHAPLSFNNVSGSSSLLYDETTTALFFPNDGAVPETLESGTWTFPITAITPSGLEFTTETVSSFPYAKVATNTKTGLRFNIFVISGTGDLTTQNAIENDAEIQGAIQVLRNVYEDNLAVGMEMEINLELVDDSSYVLIGSESELDTLFASYPESPEHDAVNIYIVESLDYLSEGVIGLASRIPGPFLRQGTTKSGTVAEYEFDGEGTILGFTLAHEFGHYLGLYHSSQTNSSRTAIIGWDPVEDTEECATADIDANNSTDTLAFCPDRDNLMFPIVEDTANPAVTLGQGRVLRLNPAAVELQ